MTILELVKNSVITVIIANIMAGLIYLGHIIAGSDEFNMSVTVISLLIIKFIYNILNINHKIDKLIEYLYG